MMELLPQWYIGHEYPLYNALLYHFSHANIFHLMGNLFVLYQLHRIWWPLNDKRHVTALIIAFLSASLAAIIPLSWKDAPTCGLSAFIFSIVGTYNAQQKHIAWKLLAINSTLALIPAYNWRIHMMAYLIAYTTCRTLYETHFKIPDKPKTTK